MLQAARDPEFLEQAPYPSVQLVEIPVVVEIMVGEGECRIELLSGKIGTVFLRLAGLEAFKGRGIARPCPLQGTLEPQFDGGANPK